MTDTGIYFLHDYIPVRLFDRYSEEDVASSKMIWDYKKGNKYALNIFTNELMQAITSVVRNQISNKIGLVAAPPSKVNKYSPIRTSIVHMANWYNQGITQREFGCDKQILDFSTLLTRVSDVSTSHKEERATYADHMNSISCSMNQLSKYWTTFIILDDVTTQGNIMDACTDILISHGAKERYILRMAIARTV